MQASRINWRGKDNGGKLQRFSQEVAAGTGLNPNTIGIWVLAENGPVENPLNIGPGRLYSSLDSAALATIRVLHQSNMAGILASAPKDTKTQLQAIAASPWDAGHYGGNGQNLASVYNDVKGNPFGLGSAADWTSYDAGNAAHDAKTAAAGVADTALAVPRFLAKLADPTLWVRVLYVLGGSVFLLAGLALLVRQLGAGSVGKVGLNPLSNAKALARVAKPRGV